MTVVAIGLHHRTAPLELLQQLTFPAEAVPAVLAELRASEVVTEAVVLSTCNRIELYVHAERFHDGFRDVRAVLGRLSGVAPDAFDPYLYLKYQNEAVRHLFEVAAGLDSVVLGEHEILGQVGRAWQLAQKEGASGPLLNLLFQRAVESGKKVRTDTEIGRSTASLGHAAVKLLRARREGLDGSSVLVVGAGELGTDVAAALCRKHPVKAIVTNRTAARADELAARLGGRSVPFAELADQLADVDVVICATGAAEPVIGLDDLRAAATGRHGLLVLDLALPRDVPAEAADLPGVDLIDLAELQAFANEGLEARRAHIDAARAVIDGELDRYRSASSARQAAPMIAGLHGWADGIRSAELDRYASRLAALNEGDRATVEALSRSIVAKILHQPTVVLREAAGTAKGDRLSEAVRELFNQWEDGSAGAD
jgi:glutamyl-tRNA reductase